MKRTLLSLAVFLIFFSGMSYSQTWNYVNSTGTTFILYGMSFPPAQSTIGFACGSQYTSGNSGVIVKTVDGGDNWVQVWPASGTIPGLKAIWFTSEQVGFAAGYNNTFLKTVDGGTSWSPITVGSDVWHYQDIDFFDANNGVAIAVQNNSSNQAAYVTSNGGTTWTIGTSGLANASVMGVSYASQNIVYAVAQDQIVYKSTDGGFNWTTGSSLSAMLLGVDYANTNFGVVGGEENIFATNNGGTSWTTYNTGYENFYGCLAMANGTGWCSGTDENFYKTTNNGATWTLDFNGSGTSTIYRIREVANGTLFACGSQGKILKMTPPLEADFTATPTTVCAGNQVNFYDNSVGAITAWSWTFEGGNPSSSTIENPIVTYDTPGTYNVQLTVTAGAFNDTELKTDYISVYGALVSPITPNGPSDVCGSYSYEYTTQAVPNADSYDWVVTPSDAGTMTGNDIVGTFMAANNWEGDYTIKVRAENQCGDGPWSPEFAGTLYHNPIVYDLIGDGVYCEGEPGSELTLTDSEVGTSYELFNDNVSTGVIVAGTGEAISFGFFEETGIYTATGFINECMETMVGQVYVHMSPAPGQASMPEGPESVCNNDVSDYSTNGAPDADEYTWTLVPTDAGILTPDGDNCSVAWAGDFTGTAYLTVTGVNDCGEGTPSEDLSIAVNASPAPYVSGPGYVCDNEEADYSTVQYAESSYEWEVIGGTIVSGAGTSQITVMWGYPGAGSVAVTEQNDAGCETTSEILLVTIDDCTGIGEPQELEIVAYPNPFNDYLHISGSNNATIKIYNLLGKEVLSIEHANSQQIINTSDFDKGIYLVKVNQADRLSVIQLVKQ
jgi:photosystem II stability/assembly factor-like uncharacterized protein